MVLARMGEKPATLTAGEPDGAIGPEAPCLHCGTPTRLRCLQCGKPVCRRKECPSGRVCPGCETLVL